MATAPASCSSRATRSRIGNAQTSAIESRRSVWNSSTRRAIVCPRRRGARRPPRIRGPARRPRGAGQVAGGAAPESALELGRELVADHAEGPLDDVVVVEQPLRGRAIRARGRLRRSRRYAARGLAGRRARSISEVRAAAADAAPALAASRRMRSRASPSLTTRTGQEGRPASVSRMAPRGLFGSRRFAPDPEILEDDDRPVAPLEQVRRDAAVPLARRRRSLRARRRGRGRRRPRRPARGWLGLSATPPRSRVLTRSSAPTSRSRRSPR